MEVQSSQSSLERWKIMAHAFAFVLGFTIIFVIGWGGAATILGGLFSTYKLIIARVGGVIVILFGFATIGWINLPWFNYDTRPDMVANSKKQGLFASGAMGVFFAAGWTPCIGATLGAILTLSFTSDSASQAMLLSGFYAMGLGVPFLILGVVVDRATNVIRRVGKYMKVLQAISAIFLIVIGVLLMSNQMTRIAIWAQSNGFFVDIPLGGATPNIAIAFLAGLLSFLSPCVLPLVPAYLGYLSAQALSDTPAS